MGQQDSRFRNKGKMKQLFPTSIHSVRSTANGDNTLVTTRFDNETRMLRSKVCQSVDILKFDAVKALVISQGIRSRQDSQR